MSRLQRQQAILRAVAEEEIGSQRQLIEWLEGQGQTATQATVSRDIRQLGLVKVPSPGGGSIYSLPGAATAPDHDAELQQAFRQFVASAAPASHMLVLRTLSGHANAAAIALDKAQLAEIVGTLAGDDTVLVLLESADDRDRVLKRFRRLLE